MFLMEIGIKAEKKESSGFDELIQKLRSIPRERIFSEGKEIAGQSVKFPGEWDLEHSSATVMCKEHSLELSSLFNSDPAKISPLLVSLLQKFKDSKLDPKNFFMYEIGVRWNKESFAEETETGDIRQFNIKESFSSKDSARTALRQQKTYHDFEASIDNKELFVGCKGEYRALIPDLITQLKPRLVILRLSAADAKVLTERTPNFLRGRLQKDLQPRETRSFELDMEFDAQKGVLDFGRKKAIEVPVSMATLARISRILNKPLIRRDTNIDRDIKNATFISGIICSPPSPKDLLRSLKTITNLLDHLRAQTIFEHPLVSLPMAKNLFEEQMRFMSRAYSEPKALYQEEGSLVFGLDFVRGRRRNLLEMAKEHFGEEIPNALEKMSPQEYLDYLKKEGYEYSGKWDKKELLFEEELKELYLLDFFGQSYAKDPKKSVEIYREKYINKRPERVINGSRREKKVNSLKKFVLPKKAQMTGFDLREHTAEDISQMILHSTNDDRFSLFMRTTLKKSDLLELQKMAVEYLGIKFQ